MPYLYLRQYKRDEVVFFRGDPANALYIIKSGKVGLSLDVKDRTETLKISKNGEAFGDNSLIDESVRIYNAVCESERAEIYVIPKVNLLEILDGHQKIKSKMLMSLAEIYNHLTSNLFKAYRSSFGFFNLSQIFIDPAGEEEEGI
ncbi:MAG: cyclic nucleotide-binding domain-containing protein [Cyclobacteriaceae bacterium]